MLLTCNNTACGGIREPNAVACPSNFLVIIILYHTIIIILYHAIIYYTMPLYTYNYNVIIYYAMSLYTIPCHYNYTIPCHYILYHAIIYYTISYHYILYHAIIYYTRRTGAKKVTAIQLYDMFSPCYSLEGSNAREKEMETVLLDEFLGGL